MAQKLNCGKLKLLSMSLTMVFTQVSSKLWLGTVEEIPGVNAQGRTQEDVHNQTLDALDDIIRANRKLQRENHPYKNILKKNPRVTEKLFISEFKETK